MWYSSFFDICKLNNSKDFKAIRVGHVILPVCKLYNFKRSILKLVFHYARTDQMIKNKTKKARGNKLHGVRMPPHCGRLILIANAYSDQAVIRRAKIVGAKAA